MIKVKLTYQYPNWPLLQQTSVSKGIWGDYHFCVNEMIEECDYWTVCDGIIKDRIDKMSKRKYLSLQLSRLTVKSLLISLQQ